jgi:hypothetical protein
MAQSLSSRSGDTSRSLRTGSGDRNDQAMHATGDDYVHALEVPAPGRWRFVSGTMPTTAIVVGTLDERRLVEIEAIAAT